MFANQMLALHNLILEIINFFLDFSIIYFGGVIIFLNILNCGYWVKSNNMSTGQYLM